MRSARSGRRSGPFAASSRARSKSSAGRSASDRVLEAAPEIYIGDKALAAAAKGLDWAEIAITSDAAIKTGTPPSDAFTLNEVEGVAVVPKLAAGKKCARSWRITDDVGSDPAYPSLSARDAAAVRELDARVG